MKGRGTCQVDGTVEEKKLNARIHKTLEEDLNVGRGLQAPTYLQQKIHSEQASRRSHLFFGIFWISISITPCECWRIYTFSPVNHLLEFRKSALTRTRSECDQHVPCTRNQPRAQQHRGFDILPPPLNSRGESLKLLCGCPRDDEGDVSRLLLQQIPSQLRCTAGHVCVWNVILIIYRGPLVIQHSVRGLRSDDVLVPVGRGLIYAHHHVVFIDRFPVPSPARAEVVEVTGLRQKCKIQARGL